MHLRKTRLVIICVFRVAGGFLSFWTMGKFIHVYQTDTTEFLKIFPMGIFEIVYISAVIFVMAELIGSLITWTKPFSLALFFKDKNVSK